MAELTQDEQLVLAGLDGGDDLGRGRRLRANMFSKLGASLFRRQMIEKIPALDAKLQKAIREDKATVADKAYFSITELSGTSTSLLLKNQKSANGLRNIDDAQVVENRPFLLQALMLRFKADASTDGLYDDVFPEELANAVFTLKVGDRLVLSKLPVDLFQSQKQSDNTDEMLGYMPLNHTKLIRPGKTIEFNIEDAAGSLSGKAKLYLIGTEVISY
jgi:hypothetical protein